MFSMPLRQPGARIGSRRAAQKPFRTPRRLSTAGKSQSGSSVAGEKRLSLSPSDLNAFLACPHLTTLELAVARGELEKPYRTNPHADLIRRKGDEHEARYLAASRDGGHDASSTPETAGRRAEARDPRPRRRDVVYQAALRRRRLARARRLRRAPAGRRLRGRRHEARAPRAARARPPALLLHRADRAHPGPHARGDARRQRARRARDLPARRLPRLLPAARAAASSTRSRTAAPTYPYPVEHCGLCDFLALCKQRWERGRPPRRSSPAISRTQVERLDRRRDHDARGARRRAARHAGPEAARRRRFDEAPPPGRAPAPPPAHRRAPRRAPARSSRSAASRSCPSRARATSGSTSRATPGSSRRAGSSTSSAGSTLDEDGEPRYDCIWAHDRAEEKAGFERLIDLIVERRRRFPGMHVYHYAPYERDRAQRA